MISFAAVLNPSNIATAIKQVSNISNKDAVSNELNPDHEIVQSCLQLLNSKLMDDIGNVKSTEVALAM